MTTRVRRLELLALPLSVQAPQAMILTPNQLPAPISLAHLVYPRLEEKKQLSLKTTSLSIPKAGDLVPKVPRLKLTPRLKRRMSGLPSRSSTLYFTTKSRSKLSCAIVKERD